MSERRDVERVRNAIAAIPGGHREVLDLCDAAEILATNTEALAADRDGLQAEVDASREAFVNQSTRLANAEAVSARLTDRVEVLQDEVKKQIVERSVSEIRLQAEVAELKNLASTDALLLTQLTDAVDGLQAAVARLTGELAGRCAVGCGDCDVCDAINERATAEYRRALADPEGEMREREQGGGEFDEDSATMTCGHRGYWWSTHFKVCLACAADKKEVKSKREVAK
jgi:hypothetical protein